MRIAVVASMVTCGLAWPAFSCEGSEARKPDPTGMRRGACEVEFDRLRGGIARIARSGPGAFNLLADGRILGEVETRVRSVDCPWRENFTRDSTDVRRAVLSPDGRTLSVEYMRPSQHGRGVRDLRISEQFRSADNELEWIIRLENATDKPLEVGDLALPLPANNHYTKSADETYNRRVFRHAFISGHGSFLFWLPTGGEGAHLVMLPVEGTSLEYFTEIGTDYAHGGGDYRVFIHSAAAGAQTPGTWRQKHTSVVLQPRGKQGDSATYGLRFCWADDYAGVREVLYKNRAFDIQVAPGMVVPEDLSAMIALRTKNRIEDIEPEHPSNTKVEYVGEKAKSIFVYRIRFSRLGENLLKVRWGGNRSMTLEFFVTESMETVIKKRAAFIAAKQQHRNPTKWYDGLFSLWDVRQPPGQNLLGPENLGGQYPYAVSGSDDPSNSKCMYLSEKNVAWPEAREVEALEYFLEHFVWGKLQRTAAERPHPYGIYGCDSWVQCRNSETGLNSGGHGQERMWRTFDYTTYFAVYYNMYRIARQRPDLVKCLEARGYLERAYGTARAYFEVPYNIHMQGWDFNGWCDWAYKIGNFHEKYLLGIIAALEEEGQRDKADWLRSQLEKKVRFFLCDDPHPWTSEMPVDSTAFESTYAAAKYALTHELPPVDRLWQDKKSGKWYSYGEIPRAQRVEFLRRQLLANLACRGWLEATYYHLGSDFRACGSGHYNLSYMSQMGGGAVLDQALYFGDESFGHHPTAEARTITAAELLRLGYASMLSSWALVNCGSAESNYGYWRPGQLHDGAVGWGFQPQKMGSEWNPACQNLSRGAWPVDGEIDHGLAAGVEAACTILVDDPIFGRFAYGGALYENGSTMEVIPRDGVRQRFHAVLGRSRLHLALDRDGFAREQPVTVDRQVTKIGFLVENRSGDGHATRLTISGLAGKHRVSVKGQAIATLDLSSRTESSIALPLDKGQACRVEIEGIAR